MEKYSRYLWSTDFAPVYSATLLAAKMSTNFKEHSLYIRFLWPGPCMILFFQTFKSKKFKYILISMLHTTKSKK